MRGGSFCNSESHFTLFAVHPRDLNSYPDRIGPTPGIPLYINECDVQQNVFSTYGEYDFLRRTYRKYDPTR